MALERETYTRPLLACASASFAWLQRVRGSQWFASKALGVGPAGASTGADLGGSSKYSSEILED
jgi:hypothetical protein